MIRIPPLLLLIACQPAVDVYVCEEGEEDSAAPAIEAVTEPTEPPGTTQPSPQTTPVYDTVDTAVIDTGTAVTTPPPCGPHGVAGPGYEYTIWPDAHTGDEHTTGPRTDANNGLDGDNPEFRRTNVARAHIDYWYSSSFQEPGEPDPGSQQYVDYTPDFTVHGAGYYEVVAHFRQTENRAPYEAHYTIEHRDGSTLVLKDQREGVDYQALPLGTYAMCPGSFVRIEDPGTASITFNQMIFRWVGDLEGQ